MSLTVLFIVLGAVALLLFLVLKLKMQAFLALIIVSMLTGILAGMPVTAILKSMQDGMGGTLGFIAVVVGLGAIFGKILEESGGAEAMSRFLLASVGKEKAPWALLIAGFLIAIPIFLDVAFIILVPVIYSLSRDSGKPLLYFAIPLLAGLAVTHSFVPPTPGPVAVAEILGANLGWVIILGMIIGFPVAVIAGPVFGTYISKRVKSEGIDLNLYHSEQPSSEIKDKPHPSFLLILLLIGLPLVLILLNTITNVLVKQNILQDPLLIDTFTFIGHPFVALTLATVLALYFLGTRRGYSSSQLLKFSTDSLAPAGIIIFVTGAGGVFKQVLIDSGIGNQLAASIQDAGIPPLLLAWLFAVIIRVTQGSATVAMITAAGLMSPVLQVFPLTEIDKALAVLAIAAGATILSHVNDSGFWLVGKYLQLSEKETLRTWTVMETIISVAGIILILLFQFVLRLF